jgi:hypothetical protein
VLATLALSLLQDQSQVAQVYRCPGFTFPEPGTGTHVLESANGQVYFVELRPAGSPTLPAYLKLFSIPNPQGAISAETLLGLSAQEFGSLAARRALTAGATTDGVQDTSAGPATSRTQEFLAVDGTVLARGRIVILQTSPMAAGALLWMDPDLPEGYFESSENLLKAVQVLPFSSDTLQPMERSGIGFALPVLWTRQELHDNGSTALNCQGTIGNVFLTVATSGVFGGELGESLALAAQAGEATAVAVKLGGSIGRRNALMRLAGEQLHVGQRYVVQLPGSQAEIRNAIFSNSSMQLCLIATLCTMENRSAMVAMLDRILASVTLPQQGPQQMEISSWSGLSVGFPERLSVELREPKPFLPGGWIFTIPHDDRPEDRSFETRIWREDLPEQEADAAKELMSSVNELVTLWPGAAIENPEIGQDVAFGQPAATLRATLIVADQVIAVDARRVVTAHGIYRSLAYFPTDLQDDHQPVLQYILEKSRLWDGTEPLTTTNGAKVRLPDASWRVRDYQMDGLRAFDLSNAKGIIIRCVPDDELTPEHDLVEALSLDYFDGDEVEQRLDLDLSGRKIPAVQTFFVREDEGRELKSIEFHALFVAGGTVWRISASGFEDDRPAILAALAGIDLAPR